MVHFRAALTVLKHGEGRQPLITLGKGGGVEMPPEIVHASARSLWTVPARRHDHGPLAGLQTDVSGTPRETCFRRETKL